jgi:Contractile injection system tube protein
MASDFPGRPWLLKGALVVFETTAPVPTNLIVFQYNPDTVSRSVQPEVDWSQSYNQQTGQRLADYYLVPSETFQLEVELDAADQLESNNVLARTVGLHPTLAALELLLYPPSADILLGKAAAKLGMHMLAGGKIPLVLLVWGAPRIVPVAVTSLSITEEAFDQILNPIRAKVSLGLRALSDKDLEGTQLDGFRLVRQVEKEVLSRANLAASAEQIIGMLPV